MYSAVGGGVAYKSPQSKVMDNAAQAYDLLCWLDLITTNRGLLKRPATIRICQVLLSVPSVLPADVRSNPFMIMSMLSLGRRAFWVLWRRAFADR